MKITFLEYNRALLKKWWLILLLGFFGIVLTFVATEYWMKPTYEAYSTVYIPQAPNLPLNYDANQLLQTWEVQKEALLQLDGRISPQELQKGLDVSIAHGTSFIRIGFKHGDKESARLGVNALAQALVDKAKEIKILDHIQILEAAELPEEPINIDLGTNIVLTLLFIGSLTVFLLHIQLSYKVKGFDMEAVGSVAVLKESW